MYKKYSIMLLFLLIIHIGTNNKSSKRSDENNKNNGRYREKGWLGPQDNRSYFSRNEFRADEYLVVLSCVQYSRPLGGVGLRFAPCLSLFKGIVWFHLSQALHKWLHYM